MALQKYLANWTFLLMRRSYMMRSVGRDLKLSITWLFKNVCALKTISFENLFVNSKIPYFCSKNESVDYPCVPKVKVTNYFVHFRDFLKWLQSCWAKLTISEVLDSSSNYVNSNIKSFFPNYVYYFLMFLTIKEGLALLLNVVTKCFWKLCNKDFFLIFYELSNSENGVVSESFKAFSFWYSLFT